MPVDLLSQLAGAAIRSVGLAVVALAGLWLFRVRSSAARHAAWTVVLLGMILQIFLGAAAPAVPLKLLPSAPVAARRRTAVLAPVQNPPAATGRRIEPKHSRISSREALSGVYLGICLVLFGRMALGYAGLRRILRNARPIATLGPRIFESPSLVVPVSAGCFRPAILLPADWRDWDPAKLRAVLAHETAHIRRRDWLIRVVSRANVCVFWFHPLAWWIERELSRLSEEACDDLVLAEIENRDEYAAILVDIAGTAAAYGGVLNRGVISMARESNVTRRVNRILDRGFQIPKPFGRLAWVMLFACSLPLVYLSAAVRLVPVHPDSFVLPHTASPPHTVEVMPAAAERKPSLGPIAQAGTRPAPPLTPNRSEDQPVSMCILIDNSGTMRDKRTRVIAAALALVRTSRPHDEVCIINFNDEVFIDQDFTSDIQEMEHALTYIDSRGGTALRDAVRLSIDQLEHKARNRRKALVVITDGEDTSSTVPADLLRKSRKTGRPAPLEAAEFLPYMAARDTRPFALLISMVRNSSVRIDCVGLLNEEDAGPGGKFRRVLAELAEASGGVAYYPKDLADVEQIIPLVAHDVQTR